MGYVKEILPFLGRCVKMISKGYFRFFLDYMGVVLGKILGLGRYNEITSTGIAGDHIFLPRNYVAFLVVYEIYVAELYKRISGLNHVLDLGGYIGDSALYLAHRNKEVTVIESDPKNYSYVLKNTSQLPNVHAHQKAVVADASHRFYLVEDNEYRGTVTERPDSNFKSTEIETVTIDHLLKQNQFDGLKMDIEGGEFSLLPYFIENANFPFKKGFIEFHFTSEEKSSQFALFNKFVSYLSANGYAHELFDNDGRNVSLDQATSHIKNALATIYYLNIYFSKITL